MGPLFITGANGLVGRAVLTALQGRASEVTCLIRNQLSASLPSAPAGWSVVTGDLSDLGRNPSLLKNSSTILHLAASTGKAPARVHRSVIIDGTRAVLSAARAAGVSRIVYVSSIAAGFADRRYYPYAEAKLAAESLISASGLDWAIVRPTMVFGRGSAVQAGLERLACAPIGVCFGRGAIRVQPVHVNDLANILLDLLESPTMDQRRFEVGGPTTLSMRDLLGRIRLVRRGSPGRFIHVPLEPLRTILGWAEPFLLPVMPLSAGQLASFANDGVATPSPLVDARRETMRTLDEMLAGSVG
jgi:NADH dehydrogenase